jgi:hypothetical protein
MKVMGRQIPSIEIKVKKADGRVFYLGSIKENYFFHNFITNLRIFFYKIQMIIENILRRA